MYKVYTASNSQERPLNGIHYYRDTHPDWTWPATEQFISKWQNRKKHNKTAKHKNAKQIDEKLHKASQNSISQYYIKKYYVRYSESPVIWGHSPIRSAESGCGD